MEPYSPSPSARSLRRIFARCAPLSAAQGGLSLASLAALRRAAVARFGGLTGACFLLITALQFHLPFYMSRTLPNVLALAVTNLGLADWVAGGRPRRAVALLTLATVRLGGRG